MSNNPIKSLAQYAVDSIYGGETTSDVAAKIAAYLVDSRKTRELPTVIRAVEKELELRGSQQVIITSAHEVSEKIKLQLASLLGANNPVFSTSIEPDMIGGVKARSGELEIDLTIRTKLNKFKAAVAGSSK